MEQTDYTYITSRMLTEICEHTEVLRKGLLVILLVLAAALTLFLIPVDNQEIRFTITVLNQTITYEVDQIRIVEPGDISELAAVPGKDYCTLVTCTPYGINTHRLLIRGTRVANEAGELVVSAEAVMLPHYLTIPAVGIPLLFLFLAAMLILTRRKKTIPGTEDELFDDTFDL